MATEKLSFVFEILDRASSPLGKIGKAFERVTSSIGTSANGGLIGKVMSKMPAFVQRGAGKVLSAFSGMGAKLAPIFGKIRGLFGSSAGGGDSGGGGGLIGGLKGIGSAALSVASVVGTAAIGIGGALAGLAIVGGKYALDAFAFKEDTLAAFKTMLKSDEAAKRVMADAIQFAAVTPFTTEEVVSSYQKLLTAGFKESELKSVMMSVGDVGAAFGEEAMASTIRAFGQIKAKGKFQGEEMMQLAEAGIASGKVYDALSKKLGKSRDEVQKLMSAGKIGAEEGISAVMAAINEGISGGQAGSLMAAKAQTISGLLSTLQSKPFEFMIALDSSKMLEPAKKFVTALTNVLTPESETGKRITAMFQMIGDAVTKVFGEGVSEEGLATGIGKVLDVLEPMLKMLIGFGSGFFDKMAKGLGPFFEKMSAMSPEKVDRLVRAFTWFGEALAFFVVGSIEASIWFAGLVTTIIDWGVQLVDKVSGIFTWFGGLPGQFSKYGQDLVQGFIDGIIGMLPNLTGAVGGGPGMAGQALAAVEGALKIHSPSLAFADLGSNAALGFIQGMQGFTPAVQGAASDMVSTRGLGGSAAAGGAPLGASIVVAAGAVSPGAIVIQGGDSPAKIAQSLEMQLGDVLSRAAAYAGAT